MAKAYISTVWRRGSLVPLLFCFLFFISKTKPQLNEGFIRRNLGVRRIQLASERFWRSCATDETDQKTAVHSSVTLQSFKRQSKIYLL